MCVFVCLGTSPNLDTKYWHVATSCLTERKLPILLYYIILVLEFGFKLVPIVQYWSTMFVCLLNGFSEYYYSV